MRFPDLFRLSLGNLFRRKMRTFLTVLGVLIGTASIVSMLSIGIAQRENMMQMIGGSTDLTTVNVYGMGGGYMYYDYSMPSGMAESGEDALQLNDETIGLIQQLPHVASVYPVLRVPILMKQGRFEGQLELIAMPEQAINDLDLLIVDGQMPDWHAAGFHFLAGSECRYLFYDPSYTGSNYEEPEIDFMNQPLFTVFDVEAYYNSMGGDSAAAPPKKVLLQADGLIGSPEGSWSEYSYNMVTELEGMKRQLKQIFKSAAWPGQPSTSSGKAYGDLIYSNLIVRSDSLDHTMEIQQTIMDMGLQADSNIQFIESMEEQFAQQQLVLGGIGAVALLVAAIGIANTMMMSIYERTKEIGIFKVLGCSLPNIRRLFLLEAAFIGLIGGILGVGLSYLVSNILNNTIGGMYYGDPNMRMSVIPPWLAGISLVFSTLIGTISGLVPAMRAMRLSPLEALRTQ